MIRIAASTCMVILLSVFVESLSAQPFDPQHGERGMGPERIEQYKKFRLIEALALDEENAVRFMMRYNAHKDSLRGFMEERMMVIDRLEEFIAKKGDDASLRQLFAALEQNDQKMFNERRRFHEELERQLTAEQMAKFFVFDRNFNRDLRRVMEDMRRDRRRR